MGNAHAPPTMSTFLYSVYFWSSTSAWTSFSLTNFFLFLFLRIYIFVATRTNWPLLVAYYPWRKLLFRPLSQTKFGDSKMPKTFRLNVPNFHHERMWQGHHCHSTFGHRHLNMSAPCVSLSHLLFSFLSFFLFYRLKWLISIVIMVSSSVSGQEWQITSAIVLFLLLIKILICCVVPIVGRSVLLRIDVVNVMISSGNR